MPASVGPRALGRGGAGPRDRRGPRSVRRHRDANISRQPGRPSRIAPCSNERRSFMVCGKVSATSRPPRRRRSRRGGELVLESVPGSAPRPRARSSWRAGPRAATASPIRSTSSSLNPLRHPGTISSSVVPEWSRHRGSTGLELGAVACARRDRLAVTVVVGGGLRGGEPERALLERLVPASGDHRVDAAPGSPTDPTASSPMTTRRRAEWPTRNPAFTPTRPSSRPSHSPKERPAPVEACSSAARGMPSTLAIMRARYSACSGPAGASEKPQLPPITVVTP